MATLSKEIPGLRTDFERAPKGPVTAARQGRSMICYAVMFAWGVLPAVLNASAAWQAAGLGLLLPGAGFVAVGGWSVMLFPLTLVLFVVSVVAWVWAGVALARGFVSLGAAALAGALAGTSVWAGAYLLVPLLIVGGIGYTARRSALRRARGRPRAETRRPL